MNVSVLVTAAGGIVAQGIIKSLKLATASKNIPVEYRIVATDMSNQATGIYRCNSGILVPSATSSNYVDSLIKVCNEQNILAIYVGSDKEMLVIGNAKDRIESETDAKVITNPLNVLNIARDKWKTCEFLKSANLPYAAYSLPENSEKFIQEFGFPLVIKPREGYGSLHFYVVNDRDEMAYAISKIQNIGWHPLLQEYLKGDNTEFTSGVTVDRFGEYIMSSITIRKIIKNGQTYKAFIDDFENIRRSAEEVALKIGARGPINIQAKLGNDIPKIFEINPRFSATCPMRSAAGINEPDIMFRNLVLNEDIKMKEYKRLVCLRYWNEIYVPFVTFEETLYNGRVDDNDSYRLDYF